MRAERAGGRATALLVVFLAVVASLLVTGYSHRLIGRSGTGRPTAAAALPGNSGPVLDLARGVRTLRLPPRTVALTFDDGPDPTWTPRLLDLLQRERVPATFFVVGSRVLDNPGLLRRELRAGNAVGAHTFTHVDLTTHSLEQDRVELSLTQKALAATAGVTTNLLRPPYSSTVRSVTAADLARWRAVAPGYLEVLADRDSEDWTRPGVARIVANALPVGDKGTVILFHDAGGNRAETLAAVTQVIDRLKGQGWRFTTVPAGVHDQALVPAATSVRVQGLALLVAEQGALWVSRVLGVLLIGVAGLSVLRAVLMVAFAHRHRRMERSTTSRRDPVPTVSVVVPAYNEQAGITGTVRTLARSDYPNVEIVVVDDGSTDDTAAVVAGLAGALRNVTLVRQANAGKARALNAGIAASSGEIVILVDGDTVVEPDTVRRLVEPFADPSVGAVAGNTKVGNRRGLLGRWQHLEYVVGFNLDRRFFDLTNCMQTIPGAIGGFRRRVLDQVGGVPVDTLAEDTDLTIAVGLAGWRVAYEGRARAWTEAPASLRALWRQRYRWAYGTMQAAWKHRRAVGGVAVSGPGGATTRLGRVGLPYLLAFGVLLPLLAPLVDLFAAVGLLFTSPVRTAVAWAAFGGMQFLLAAYALRLDGERLRTLWALPVQQIVYRQLMYLVVVEATLAAVTGRRLRWHKLPRAGTAAQTLTTVPDSGRPSAELELV